MKYKCICLFCIWKRPTTCMDVTFKPATRDRSSLIQSPSSAHTALPLHQKSHVRTCIPSGVGERLGIELANVSKIDFFILVVVWIS